jgi:hypothetical protein
LGDLTPYDVRIWTNKVSIGYEKSTLKVIEARQVEASSDGADMQLQYLEYRDSGDPWETGHGSSPPSTGARILWLHIGPEGR